MKLILIDAHARSDFFKSGMVRSAQSQQQIWLKVSVIKLKLIVQTSGRNDGYSCPHIGIKLGKRIWIKVSGARFDIAYVIANKQKGL